MLELPELPVITTQTHPCEDCQSGCCRSFAVPLTLGDIARISHGTGLGFWDFVARWEDHSGAIARGQAPHFHFQDEPQTPFVIGLKHIASQTFAHATKCRFLMEAADGACCGVYEHRPLACRIFPATAAPNGDLTIAPIPAFGRPGADPAYRLCSRAWTEADIDWSEKQHEFERARDEMNLMHVIADRWNQRPGDWIAFPDFLALIWQRLSNRYTSRGED